MLTRIVVTLVMAAMPATALGQAKIIVELVPQHPGPYKGGESFLVDVWLHSQVSFDVTFRLVQLDFSQSDPAISLDSTFVFDFSAIPNDIGGYSSQPDLPVPWTWNGLDCVCPDIFLPLPGEGSLHIGRIGVQLPLDIDVYRLDVMNADKPDLALGARFSLTGSPGWRAFTGEIAGGRFHFLVGPEGIPTVSQWGIVAFTLLLLGAGTLVMHRRCQANEGGSVQ